MSEFPPPLDLTRVNVKPLAQRHTLSPLNRILVEPASAPPAVADAARAVIEGCAAAIRAARQRGASVMLIYGGHLVKNGAMAIVNTLIRQGWLTHLATNGAGTIHDWELAYFGQTEESVRENIARGQFGTWDETGRAINLAVLAGALRGEGFGRSLGRFICEDGTSLPSVDELKRLVVSEPGHPFTAARADLLQTMLRHQLAGGRIEVKHPHRQSSIVGTAFECRVPLTAHPGIGYDIYATHPLFSGAAIGRAGGEDFRSFSRAVEGLDGGVVLSVGSAVMGPQVFEKSVSCVNNLRLQDGRAILEGHSMYVVDLQDGGSWDWSAGEPPKSNPAYYLRFCKSYARMGGAMHYLQCHNTAFVHHLLARLNG
ncbi:MAG: hypothetical protein MUE94_00970 [Verrucomicrobia bacterium]|jgi:hypothetical protein|nr:hypothetical protein [Verrucomicrobiota bacterium]